MMLRGARGVKKAAPAKKRIGRPPGRKAPRRPVLSARVPLDFYEDIKASAQRNGRTASEELIFLARQQFTRTREGIAPGVFITKELPASMRFHRDDPGLAADLQELSPIAVKIAAAELLGALTEMTRVLEAGQQQTGLGYQALVEFYLSHRGNAVAATDAEAAEQA
jgi:hypothetical protein